MSGNSSSNFENVKDWFYSLQIYFMWLYSGVGCYVRALTVKSKIRIDWPSEELNSNLFWFCVTPAWKFRIIGISKRWSRLWIIAEINASTKHWKEMLISKVSNVLLIEVLIYSRCSLIGIVFAQESRFTVKLPYWSYCTNAGQLDCIIPWLARIIWLI